MKNPHIKTAKQIEKVCKEIIFKSNLFADVNDRFPYYEDLKHVLYDLNQVNEFLTN